MPCKHEGGSDPCDADARGECKVNRRRRVKQWRQNNEVLVGDTDRAVSSDRGTAAELLVEAQLLLRGLLVGRPSNRAAKHDLFVKAGGAWRTIQVRTGRVTISGAIHSQGSKGIVSDLIARVDVSRNRIRWTSNTQDRVPLELLDEMS